MVLNIAMTKEAVIYLLEKSFEKLTGFDEILRKCCLDFCDVPDYQLDPGMF